MKRKILVVLMGAVFAMSLMTSAYAMSNTTGSTGMTGSGMTGTGTTGTHKHSGTKHSHKGTGGTGSGTGMTGGMGNTTAK